MFIFYGESYLCNILIIGLTTAKCKMTRDWCTIKNFRGEGVVDGEGWWMGRGEQ